MLPIVSGRPSGGARSDQLIACIEPAIRDNGIPEHDSASGRVRSDLEARHRLKFRPGGTPGIRIQQSPSSGICPGGTWTLIGGTDPVPRGVTDLAGLPIAIRKRLIGSGVGRQRMGGARSERHRDGQRQTGGEAHVFAMDRVATDESRQACSYSPNPPTQMSPGMTFHNAGRSPTVA